MYAHVEKPKDNKSRTAANVVSQKQNGNGTTFQFVNNRPEVNVQRKRQSMANTGARMKKLIINKNTSDYNAQLKPFTQASAASYFAAQNGPIEGKSVIQLKRYKSIKHPLAVEVNADNEEVSAQATSTEKESGKKYEQSSLGYALYCYMNEDNLKATSTPLPMATQTSTMHADPQECGVGTLMIYEAVKYLQSQGIRYFQPDDMRSFGGNIMMSLVKGKIINRKGMAKLLGDDRDESSCCCGCWEFIKSLFSKPKSAESRLLEKPSIHTYPAIEVDFTQTNQILLGKVNEKFKADN